MNTREPAQVSGLIPDWSALREALSAYDTHVDLLDDLETVAAVKEWITKEHILGQACAEAFWEATADYNSRENAMLCAPCYWTKDDFIHRIIH